MKNKKMLLIIDAQYDFINGSLAVNGAEDKMNALAMFMKEHGKDYACVAMTADWHPISHCSFKQNGGIWPVHCVQHSHGASIFENVLSEGLALNAHIFTKGDTETKEEYSVMDNAASSEELVKMILNNGINEIDVCGIAGDFCVLESLKGLRNRLSDIKMNAIERFIPFINDPNWEEFEKINVNVI